MPEVRKVSIGLGELIKALKATVEAGQYDTTNAIVPEFRDSQLQQVREENIKRLRQLWNEGKSSGPARPLDIGKLRREARTWLKAIKKAGGEGR